MVMKELEMNNSFQGSMYSSSSKSSQHSVNSRRSDNKNGGMPVGTGIDGLGDARENMLFGLTKPFSRKSIKI